jgi:flagellar hook protein FlgE
MKGDQQIRIHAMSISNMMNTALSGMQAQTNRLSAVANNLANSDTPGYSRLATNLTATDWGGVEADVSTSSDPAAVDGGSNVDPAHELLDMTEAALSFKANASAFETGADLWDVLMSVKRD